MLPPNNLTALKKKTVTKMQCSVLAEVWELTSPMWSALQLSSLKINMSWIHHAVDPGYIKAEAFFFFFAVALFCFSSNSTGSTIIPKLLTE